MQLSEFKNSFVLLRGAYGERAFPKEREGVLWRRYEHCPDGTFKSAVEFVLLRMPPLHTVIECLDDKLAMRQAPVAPGPVHECQPCHDRGITFSGDTAVACSCWRGRTISPSKLAHEQKAYNEGREIFTKQSRHNPLPELPYDPKKRVGA